MGLDKYLTCGIQTKWTAFKSSGTLMMLTLYFGNLLNLLPERRNVKERKDPKLNYCIASHFWNLVPTFCVDK